MAVNTGGNVSKPSCPNIEKDEVEARTQEILNMTRRIVENVTTGDFETFTNLTEPNITVFEPETVAHLVQGQNFHRLYFDPELRQGIRGMSHEFLSPVVHLLGEDAASIACIRLTQYIDGRGVAHTDKALETRVWQRRNGQWRVLHYHAQAVPTQ